MVLAKDGFRGWYVIIIVIGVDFGDFSVSICAKAFLMFLEMVTCL